MSSDICIDVSEISFLFRDAAELVMLSIARTVLACRHTTCPLSRATWLHHSAYKVRDDRFERKLHLVHCFALDRTGDSIPSVAPCAMHAASDAVGKFQRRPKYSRHVDELQCLSQVWHF